MPYVSARDSYLIRTYGITEAQYLEILAEQGGACAICRKPPKGTTNLAVDHDHKSGRVRGLLCTHCNFQVIGRLRDASIFLRAYEYLTTPPASLVLGEHVVPTRPRRRRRTASSRTRSK